MDRLSRRKINKETVALNDSRQVDLINIFETFTQKQQNIYSLSIRGSFSKTDHILGYKTSPNKFKIEFLSSSFSDHNDLEPEINYKKTEKHRNTRLNNKQ